MSDLQDLFDRLKAQTSSVQSSEPQMSMQNSIWNEAQQNIHQQPSVSSPIVSPPSHTPNPIHSSRIMSPVHPISGLGTPAADQNRSNNLLNLLKFGNQGSQAGPMANLQNVGGLRSSSLAVGSDGGDASQGRPLSAHGLMASFQRKSSSQNVAASPITITGAERSDTPTKPTSDSKDFLLNLLTKPKDSKPSFRDAEAENTKAVVSKEEDAILDRLSQSFADASLQPPAAVPSSRESRETTPVRQFGAPGGEHTPFEAPLSNKASQFAYVNPFDQLHNSSPLVRSPKPAVGAESKNFDILKHSREVTNPNGPSAAPAAKHRKLVSGDESPVRGSTAVEPQIGESVSAALESVGEKVDKQVAQALADADAQEKAVPDTVDLQGSADVAAVPSTPIKQESVDNDDEIASNWEVAEDEDAEKEEDSHVEVYNFPMKPFVSIHIKDSRTPRPIRQTNFMHVAHLKKEFDQIDRCLATASQSHIVYAQGATKKDNGGFRIIRQDNGLHKQVFRSSGERIFSVQLCSSAAAASDLETVIGTGVNGTIFWTSLAKSRGDLFPDDDIEAQGFVMPPVSTQEEQASGTQVKSRAKMSSRHPDYFAVARSKYIYLIAPETVKGKAYTDGKTRKVDSEKYLAEHGLRIMTQKACKDFCFSEDDTVIVSLDKSGRFKFWDIKDMTSRASDSTEGKHEPVELTEAVWQLSTATSGSKPEEKPSVSSIMFLDKDRPMTRGLALRYMLIGFKQNHILQLWDLGLGKAVQEIRLPHEKDSDGICSLTYHPKSGIIAVGHPTRNSIYFIHLSAPRYALPHIDQAKYVSQLARSDSSLPRPESTAIMSGLREFSFAKAGQLRSLDMLRTPVENASDPDTDDATLFELYVMHSKGVVGMSVKRKDLGWDKDSKMVKPIDGVQTGMIEVKELVTPPKPTPSSEQSSNAETPAKPVDKPATAKKQETVKPSASTPLKPIIKREAPTTPLPLNTSTPRATASKQVPEAPLPSQQNPPNPPLTTADSYAMAAQETKSLASERPTESISNASKPAVPPPAEKALAPQVPAGEDVQSALTKQFEVLYSRISRDKQVHDATSAAQQDAVLRLVSSTLTENVEQSLHRIVSKSMTEQLVPSIVDSVNKTVERKLAETLPQQLSAHLPKEFKEAFPHALQQALKDPHIHGVISNQVAQKVQQQVSQLLQQSMPTLATQAAQKMVADLETRTQQQLREAESRRQQDNVKIQELSSLVQGLSQMISNMSESQSAFQEQILKMQRPSSRANASEAASASASALVPTVDPQKAAEAEEVNRITQLLTDGEYDAATIAWLQSARQAELFDEIFNRVNPRYLERVRPLVVLSVSAAVTASFEVNLSQRLEWLGIILDIIDLSNTDIKEVAPKIMDVLSSRLQGAYMSLSEANSGAPELKRIVGLNRKVGEVRRLAG